jgi:hypothetical protein
MASAMTSPVAVYERVVGASLERVWENVLDWEHLPWLHRATFGHVRLLDASADGWRAEASMRSGGAPFVLDVALDRPALRYVARTVDGPGAGTEIVTQLAPTAAHATAIRVAFHLPDVPSERRDAIGAAYVWTYTRLWDEDEAMMVRRQLVVDGRVVEPEREVALGDVACRFSTVCPHLGGPLADATVDADGVVTCPWHGHRFDVRTGRRHSS